MQCVFPGRARRPPFGPSPRELTRGPGASPVEGGGGSAWAAGELEQESELEGLVAQAAVAAGGAAVAGAHVHF